MRARVTFILGFSAHKQRYYYQSPIVSLPSEARKLIYESAVTEAVYIGAGELLGDYYVLLP